MTVPPPLDSAARTTQYATRNTIVASPLDAFFNPAGVAVIGASANPNKLSYGILRNLISFGYRGAVYPVNPGRDVILDLPCYPTITAVPDPLDLAVIVVPAPVCPAALHECGVRGVKAAIVISGGFRETGPVGLALEEELLEIARQHGIRLIGPNCVGTLDAYSGLDTSFIRTMPEPGDIAFISQSGAICGGILEWTAGKGVGFSRFATLGNAADVTETDLIEALAGDPRTKVIVAYLEAIKDGPRFIDVAGRVTPEKPILVIKAGTTEAGTRAVSSHTGSLAGAMAAYDAAFRQSGVIRVDTVEDLFNFALALAYGPLPRGHRVAIVTNAGGPASLAADALEEAGLSMPAPSEATRDYLAAHTCSEAQLGNPVDMLGGADAADYEMAVRALLADPAYDAVLPILVPQALVSPAAVAEAIGRASSDFPDKPVVTCFMGDEAVREPMVALHRHRIALYQFPKQAARALGVMWRYAEGREGKERKRERRETGEHGSERRLKIDLPVGRMQLGEAEARPVLAAYGIAQPRAGLARSSEDAAQIAVQVGFPVALKVVSPDIFHKSEVGGIALKLGSADEVRDAYTTMMARIQERQPGARIDGALVTQMARPGHEVIVGMRRDPQFGPLLMFGLGGIYVELLRDVAFRVAPFDRAQTLAMIDETHAGKLLHGLRGQPPSDIDAVAVVIERIARLALDYPLVREIDINPLIVYPAGQGALAVDARLVLDPAG
ncbi:MAG: acetate--CoA ligase family protein [Caldilineales bacterium]